MAPLRRLAMGAGTLLLLSLLTFALLDVAPRTATFRSGSTEPRASQEARLAAIEAMRIRAGLVDPVTGAERGLAERYVRWLGAAVTLRLAPPGETPAAFQRRIGRALGLSALLGVLATVLALGLGVPLGAWLGFRTGTRTESAVSGFLLVLGSLPQFLLATLAVVALGTLGSASFLPVSGLGSSSPSDSALVRSLDLLRHLLVPAVVLSLGPLATTTRFLRESVQRSREAEWVVTMRAWGVAERTVRRRVLANATTPMWTWSGTLVPFLLVGSVVIEQVFDLPGFGHLSVRAAFERDVATATTTTMISAAIILLGLTASDLLHRLTDPRVRLR